MRISPGPNLKHCEQFVKFLSDCRGRLNISHLLNAASEKERRFKKFSRKDKYSSNCEKLSETQKLSQIESQNDFFQN